MDLNFKEFGAGEPLVILHGLFGTLDNWQTIAKWLSADFTVFILDLPNHGRSPHTSGEFDYSEMSDAVAEFLQRHWVYETRLVGHSMGGKLAMQMALDFPDLVKKLAVIDIAPKKYGRGHEDIFAALFALDLATLKDRKQAEAFLMEKLKGDAGTVQFLLKNLTRKAVYDEEKASNTEGVQYEWKMNLPVLFANYPRIMGAVGGEKPFPNPTLFVRGSKSDYIQDADLQLITQLFPKARLETVDGAGHWVHADKPKELFEILKNFL